MVSISGKSIISFEGQPSSIFVNFTELISVPFLSFKTNITQPISINLNNIQNVKSKTTVFAFSVQSSTDISLIKIHHPNKITVSLEKYVKGTYSMAGFHISNPSQFLSLSSYSSIHTLLENEETDIYLYVISPKSNESKHSYGFIIGIIVGCVVFVSIIIVVIIIVLRKKNKNKIESKNSSESSSDNSNSKQT